LHDVWNGNIIAMYIAGKTLYSLTFLVWQHSAH